MVEEGKGGLLERLLAALTIALQGEQGSSGFGRLPTVGRLDQKVVVKRTGLPSLLYLPSLGEQASVLPSVVLHLFCRLPSLALLAAYWQAYTLLPLVLGLRYSSPCLPPSPSPPLSSLSSIAAIKLLRLTPGDALASSLLSLGGYHNLM